MILSIFQVVFVFLNSHHLDRQHHHALLLLYQIALDSGPPSGFLSVHLKTLLPVPCGLPIVATSSCQDNSTYNALLVEPTSGPHITRVVFYFQEQPSTFSYVFLTIPLSEIVRSPF